MTTPPQSVLRQDGLRARRALDAGSRAAFSEIITSRFLRSPRFLSAQSVACYLSTEDEVDVLPIISRCWAASKRVYLPVTAPGRRLRFVEVLRKTRLRRSSFGLFEPQEGDEIDPLEIDTVVVPMVAFDDAGCRIGMGGGYYDTTFRALRRPRALRTPKLIGVAFECQKVQKIKANPWDIAVCEVLTEA